MKYIKTYENEKIYNVGDYVLLDTKKMQIDNAAFGLDPINPDLNLAQIILIERSGGYPYIVRFSNDTRDYVKLSEIERLLTEEEIEEYKDQLSLYIDSNKYNL